MMRGTVAGEGPLDQVLLHYALTWVRAQRGDVSGALEHGRQALEWATRTGNLAMQAIGYGSRGWALLHAGRLEEAIGHLEQSVVLALDRGMLEGFAANQSLPLLAETHLRLGAPAAARAAADRGIAVACGFGYRHAEARNGIWLARALIAAGGEMALVRTAELATAIEARDLRGVLEEVRAELAELRGDTAAAELSRREAARLHRDNGEEWLASQVEARIGR
jgi:hypothetical protein